MSYKITPEQLREWASRCEARLDPTSDPAQLRAHADALEELAALREQLAERENWDRLRGEEARRLANEIAEARRTRDVVLSANVNITMERDQIRKQLAERDAEIAALKGHAVEPRIGLNSDGSLDEVVGSPGHIEQLDSGHWFVEIGEYAIWLHAKGKIVAHYEHRAAYPKE